MALIRRRLVLLLIATATTVIISSAFSASSPYQDDELSLLAFKASITHDPSNLLRRWNWNPSNNSSDYFHCRWYGVSCDPISFRVVSLNLTSASLVGTLSPSILNLTHLQSLSLPNNFFSGTVPHGLIGAPALTSIDLSNNHLSGPLHVTSTCQLLQHLNLSNNSFIDQIPAAIGKCSNLRTLLLDGNIFQGKLPPEIGLLSHLLVLDVSRNSLTDAIPAQLAACRKLTVLILTNILLDPITPSSSSSSSNGDLDLYRQGEFNAFQGGIPHEIFLLPDLKIFWAPRSNLRGSLPTNWNHSCSLTMLNLGQNYITGTLPESMFMSCTNLTFLDLSSNRLQGQLPSKMNLLCIVHLNISCNSFSGFLPSFRNGSCSVALTSSYFEWQHYTSNFLGEEDIGMAYSNIGSIFSGSSQMNTAANFTIALDFSWNGFVGQLPSFSTGHDSLLKTGRASYQLFLNNNKFNGSLPAELFSNCNKLRSFSVNLNANQISGRIDPQSLLNCLSLSSFEAVGNQIDGPIPPEIGSLKMLEHLDLSRNMLSGFVPSSLGELNNLKWILLAYNNLTGMIPAQLGQLTSLSILLLDHNSLSGEIPTSFSNLRSLKKLDLSFNNLSGRIPQLPPSISCDSFTGNSFLHSCPNLHASSPAGLPVPLEVHQRNGTTKLRSFVIAMVTSATVVLCVLVVMVIIFLFGRRKLGRLISLRRKVLVTFADAPPELNYDNVVATTGNFSISNLIGTGGFGSTYKAELLPGFLVAVKRLAIGRFQGIQQFDAEIRTLGRIRHEKLVTLIGYYVGEDEMFLVYNYLSGGNLERFIHERSEENFQWPVILKIAIDIAEALTFLHNTCMPRIVHRDIKPSNILLDQQLNAYLSDFGLARLIEVTETHATTDVAGTFGYVAPEYATTCRVTEKSDVYSFGVVLLELVSGKKSLDPSFHEYGDGFNIVAWAKLLINEGRSSEAFSTELWESGPSDNLLQLLILASACTAESLSVRPSMHQVLQKLRQLQT